MAASAGGGGLGTIGWVAVAGAVSAAAAGGAYYAGVFDRRVTEPVELVVLPLDASDAPQVTGTETVPPQDTATEQKPAVETARTSLPVAATEPVPEQVVPELAAPSFDLVRVEADGTTVIAGTGTAGSTVTLLLDNAVQDAFDVDASGSFVSFLLLPPSHSPRILSMIAELAGQKVLSDDQIILAPTPRAEPEPTPDPLVAEVAPVEKAQPDPEPVAEATPEPEQIAQIASEPAQAEDVVPDPEPIVHEAEPAAVAQAVEEQVAAAEAVVSDAMETPAIAATAQPEADPELASGDPAPKAEDTAIAVVEPEPDDETPLADAPLAPAEPKTVVPDRLTVQDDPAKPAEAEMSEQVAAFADPVEETDPVVEPTISPKLRPEPPINSADAADPDQPALPDTTPVAETVVETDPALEPETTPIAVLRADADGVELIQSGTAPRPEVLSEITLETISYSEDGEVQLTGRAGDSAIVRVYLDNQPVTDLGAGADGKWKGELQGVEPGIYTLRLDELNAMGEVVSRLETPFKRESPEVLVPAGSQDPGAPPPIRAVTVQKGDTLWAISRDRYGDGVLYVKVFDANRNSIRNPDLIYPGQVFSIPD